MKLPDCLFLLAILFFQSCGNRSSTQGNSILRYNEPAGITGLDPAKHASRVENIWIINQVFSTLVRTDSLNNPSPLLATFWSFSEQENTLLMQLRTDVYFHASACFGKAGTRKLIASDVVFSLSRLLDAHVASSGAWVLDGLNTKAKHPIIALNDSVILFALCEPFERFLRKLSTPYAGITCSEAVSFYGNDFRKHPIGTGPFYIKEWTEGQKLVLRKNKTYFLKDNQNKPLPYLDAIAVSFLKDRQSAFLEFLKGNFDFISGIDGSYKDELVTGNGQLRKRYTSEIQMHKTPYLKCDYLGFCLDTGVSRPLPEPYRNALVRKAIALCINRKKLIRYLRRSIGISAESGIVPESLPGMDKKKRFFYDPSEVKRLLNAAGYPNGKGLPPLNLVISSAYQDIAEFIQQECKNVGIPIILEVVLPAVQSEWVANGEASFFRKSWVADFPDPQNFLFLFSSEQTAPAGPNYTRFHSFRFDSLYAQYLAIQNDSARKHLLSAMMDHLQQEVPVIPLFYDEVVYFVSLKVKGLKPESLNYPRFETVEKLPDT